MKKVYSARTRGEILKDKEAYEQEYNEQLARYNAQEKEFGAKENEVIAVVSDYVNNKLAKYIEPLNLEIRIDRNLTFRNGAHDACEVVIESDERKMFDEDTALTWSYRVTLDEDGEVKAESGSYSGLKATNPEEIQNLKDIVSCLETINSIDWKSVLNENMMPRYRDYITERDPSYDHGQKMHQFDQELMEADIDAIVGLARAVKCREGRYYNGDVWLKIDSQSEKQYTVGEISDRMMNDPDESQEEKLKDFKLTYRITKEKFFESVYQPLEIRDI